MTLDHVEIADKVSRLNVHDTEHEARRIIVDIIGFEFDDMTDEQYKAAHDALRFWRRHYQ